MAIFLDSWNSFRTLTVDRWLVIFTVAYSIIDTMIQILDITQGLESLHNLKIIHGDLKGVSIVAWFCISQESLCDNHL
jgi:serine/threonine protein kinase